MKYPCGIIQDLLPLYHDGVCSQESRQIIEAHLEECSDCKQSYLSLGESDALFPVSQEKESELKKAASFRAVKQKLLKKQFIAAVAALLLCAAAIMVFVGVMKHTQQVISYDEHLSVSMVDDQLMARLQGNEANYLKIKRVETTQGKQNKTYLFFYLSGTKWDEWTTRDEVFSEYVLCPADKGAEQIDQVLYYTGDYTGIESMNANELEQVIEQSVLLWQQ